MSFSFEKAVTDHQLSVIKKQFKGQTIDSVNLDGDQNVTLSFVQKGSVSDCNKDFSALFPNSLMKSQAHFHLLVVRRSHFLIRFHYLRIKMVRNFMGIMYLLL